ncbi:sensor histidine kinase [Streptomyces acidiscabies]|uniref:histidine kinase n=1 Tax=Streptomyces acidiscabies TaxID=42234 RepID=A0AAP6EKJ6_9ACTN|nr:ATP-binding protein [Streptomyces acidiscabies]MBZ3915246.1 ATP-binding protein [Streptomyces acidiscabies]MDX2966063.1 ATP-binding protein [Streptomyces acidiscabies]MDX3021308.1 ATP-binding protein [Streptomyces acidiscabies]MDX3793439.1 ATP-binding protein [Streptomyces acidiscabies]GAQ54843.1 sensory histidine kinase CreC [Streptomyces acidiscabies]
MSARLVDSPRHRRPAPDVALATRLRQAAVVPLLLVAMSLVVTGFCWWQGAVVGAADVLMALACAVIVSTGYGLFLAGQLANSAEQASREAQMAEHERIVRAAEAAVTTVSWSSDELCRGNEVPLPSAELVNRDEGLAALAESELAQVTVAAVLALRQVQEESESLVLLGLLRSLPRRQHLLVSRMLDTLTKVEHLTDDPEMLQLLFKADHQTTRLRRQVESMAVLGGESLRDTREPVPLSKVLDGAVVEVEEYPRVTVVHTEVGNELALRGHAGAELSHLLAELIENGLRFSPPSARVTVRTDRVPAGVLVLVEDQALTMPDALRVELNRLLKAPNGMDIAARVKSGKLGLVTAAKIAHQLGIDVQLVQNTFGGSTAQVVVPSRLLRAALPPQPVGIPDRTWSEPAGPVSPARQRPFVPSPRPDHPPAGDGAPPLPRRKPAAVPPAAERPTDPRAAPDPGAFADFLDGQQSAAPHHA